MAKRGRPKVSWQHLRARCARRSVWERRRREQEQEEQEQAGTATAQPFLDLWQRECATFLARSAEGDTITRNFDGSKFDWPQFHNLTQCRTYAQRKLQDPDVGEWTKELCTRFLKDLETPPDGCALDCVAAGETLDAMLAVYGPKGEPVNLLRLLAMVEFLAWKKPDGEGRFPDETLLEFHETDIATMDQAFIAQQTVCATQAAYQHKDQRHVSRIGTSVLKKGDFTK
jgi:hypothetical protein